MDWWRTGGPPPGRGSACPWVRRPRPTLCGPPPPSPLPPLPLSHPPPQPARPPLLAAPRANSQRYAQEYAPLNDYTANCLAGAPSNYDCTEFGPDPEKKRYGCSLYQTMWNLCNQTRAPNTCALNSADMVYSSDYDFVPATPTARQDCRHVIAIPTSAIRGVEDVYADVGAAKKIVGNHFNKFWADSVAFKTGNHKVTTAAGKVTYVADQGFDRDMGALVINPPSPR